MDIPDEAVWHDWPPDVERRMDLDEEYAHKRFVGKSQVDAVQLFRTFDVLALMEDLECMPPVPFRYYMGSFKSFVLEEVERADKADKTDWLIRSNVESAVYWFLTVVERKLSTNKEWIAPIMSELMPAIELVAKKNLRFDADRDVYTDHNDELQRIRKLWGA